MFIFKIKIAEKFSFDLIINEFNNFKKQ